MLSIEEMLLAAGFALRFLHKDISLTEIERLLAGHIASVTRFSSGEYPSVLSAGGYTLELRRMSFETAVKSLAPNFEGGEWSYSAEKGWEGSVAEWTAKNGRCCRIGEIFPPERVYVYWMDTATGQQPRVVARTRRHSLVIWSPRFTERFARAQCLLHVLAAQM